MDPESIPFGKRLKSNKDRLMRYRHPGSETVKTLPAGKPSPVVKSYVLQSGGFYALKGDAAGDYYLKDTPDLTVVEPDAKDESGLFSGVYNWIGDAAGNTVRSVEKNAGFVSEGFSKSINEVGGGLLSFGGDLRLVLVIGVSVLVLAVVGMIINAIR